MIKQFQVKSRETSKENPGEDNISFFALGFAGEAGEVVNEIKKLLRDEKGVLMEHRRNKIVEELGDALWYLSRIADCVDTTLEEVAGVNLEKIKKPKTLE